MTRHSPPVPANDQAAAARQVVVSSKDRPYRIFIVAGEHSGDALGARLMAALNTRLKGRVRYLGVGGELMEREGLLSQFPLADVAVMGPMSILPRLPRIVRRVYRTVDAAAAAQPDVVVIIDSPEFTHPIAKRIRRRLPSIPIVDYVSPTVWAWRPGRARKMKPYVDHLLALLPFEPAEHRRLGGPPCTYIGHPLSQRLDWLENLDPQPLRERLGIAPGRDVLVALPGSRRSEVTRLLGPFSGALDLLRERGREFDVIIPTASSVRVEVREITDGWPVRPHLTETDEDKFRAFKLARAALAASGTVTLELAAAGTPTVVAYTVDAVAAQLRFLVNVPSIVLANLVLGENAYPEYILKDCNPEKLSGALELLLLDTPERATQLRLLAKIPDKLVIEGKSPSELAADIVMEFAEHGRHASDA